MKLGALKSAIRAHDGPPKMAFLIAGRHQAEVRVNQGDLLEALDKAFPAGRAEETGLFLRNDGFLMLEEHRDA